MDLECASVRKMNRSKRKPVVNVERRHIKICVFNVSYRKIRNKQVCAHTHTHIKINFELKYQEDITDLNENCLIKQVAQQHFGNYYLKCNKYI